ncbi:MAG: hypothetical protein HYV36_06300 [Lentisphaerae bacterium]|nr:hypothetical protein [Lentisphaerota bacterium]
MTSLRGCSTLRWKPAVIHLPAHCFSWKGQRRLMSSFQAQSRILIENVIVQSHHRLKGSYFVLKLKSQRIARIVQPGQFVHLRVPPQAEALLRRPFSVFQAQSGSLAILYKPIGKGTQAMAALRPGDEVNLLGPLGHGFPSVRKNTLPILVAGGYGMAALYLVAQRSRVKGIVFVGGARAADILCVSDFRRLGWDARVATEDGSAGRKGLVTHLLDAWLKQERRGREPEFFACGPNGLLQAVCTRAAKGNWSGWISLDRHLGCGL